MLAKVFTPFFFLAVAVAAPEPEKRQIDSIIDVVTSDVGGAFTSATGAIGELATKVETVAGSVFTVVTAGGGSVAGEAITLAQSGAGIVTSFGGSVFTVATAAAVSGLSAASTGATAAAATSNSPNGAHSFQLSTSVLAPVAAVAGGMMFGAWAAF
ncbi:hypothetical protein OF83DRAFT_1107627 [Amylostereum chailletii]|nr:hypothetical protein OF83DRAFT_1107627 [Amylostereum chailletii]